jgi:transposase
MVDLEAVGLRSYIAEPARGRRCWTHHPEARGAVYRNRRRIRGVRGRRLLRQRGERLERPFAHLYRTGRLRRVHVRGQANILKRVLLQTGACNLGLLMRTRFGIGTPRRLQSRPATAVLLLAAIWQLVYQVLDVLRDLRVPPVHPPHGDAVIHPRLFVTSAVST